MFLRESLKTKKSEADKFEKAELPIGNQDLRTLVQRRNSKFLEVPLTFISLWLWLILIPLKLGSAVFLQDNTPQKSSAKKFPHGYFIVPTDSSLKIAGNFGEIRPNHFHAGLDIKTGGKEGTYILSAADGYVSRIKISPYGYGKALYITHPNGYVTVYAHLKRFYGKIAGYVKSEQYRLESFETELFPDSNLLRVKQHDTIAISGNTGGSQSPHLHFEVRDAKTENALNPFLFGYKIDDTVPPNIKTVAIYPINDSSYVDGKTLSKKARVHGSKGKYMLPLENGKRWAFSVHGDIGFGIETYDYSNVAQYGKLGVYSVDLYIDGKRIYYYAMNEISFNESRYVNSHIDYAEEIKSKKEIQKCFLDENNRLSIYQFIKNEGVVHFDDTTIHKVTFIVKDFFNNASAIEVKVKSVLPVGRDFHPITDKAKPVKGIKFKCSEENIFETQDIKVTIPACALYTDINFEYSMSGVSEPLGKDILPRNGKKPSKTFSPVHNIHRSDVPLHTNYTISILASNIPESLISKATIVMLDGNNNKSSLSTFPILVGANSKIRQSINGVPGILGIGGAMWLTTETNHFGRFTVAIDTVAPFIKPYNIYNGKNMKGAKTISVIVKDNLTGIKSYSAAIDGKWILMEYEYKKNILFYEFDEKAGKGKHVFELTVTDGKNNVSRYKTEFVR